MMHRRIFACAAATGFVLLALAGSASAQTPAEFYKGKNVQLLVGFGPGGDDDLWARLISKHMGRYIPGNPTIVPQNLAGAAGLLVVNRLYNATAKDGSVFGMINRGIPFEPLLGGQGTMFDVAKLNWIGSPNRDTTVCGARKDAQVKNIQDLFSKDLKVGGTGSGADTAIYPEFLSKLLGMHLVLVQGYSGSHEIQLAMERNEVQGICLAYDSFSRSTLFKQNQLNILLQASLEPDPRLKGIPSPLESAHSPEDRQALQLFFSRAAIGRPFVAPPDVPADRLAALRQAFEETLRDPAFLEEAKIQNLNVTLITSKEMGDIVAAAYRTPPEVVQRTKSALGRTN
jgi:tripartite-type tricarboxylate transporter receptor subunit TctC